MQRRPATDSRAEFNVTLNGYRGLCAMFVLVFHLGSAGVIAWPFRQTQDAGIGALIKEGIYHLWASLSYGVDMFFMISGFVILGSLLRHERVGRFIQDRCIRIFTVWVPALCAVTLICVAFRMKVFADTTLAEGIWIFVANLFLLPPLAPLPLIHIGSWSLTYEWVFYLTAAAGALAYRRAPGALWTTAVWAIPATLFIFLFPRAIFFLTGVLVFNYRDRFAAHARWCKWPLISLLVFLISWRSIGIADDDHATNTLTAFVADGRWLPALIAFVASLHLFACVCLNSSKQMAFLNGRTFQFLGTISYSLYLWHVLVMAVTKRVAINFITPRFGEDVAFGVFAVSSVALAIPLSWLSWKLFEVMLARKARHALRREPVVATAVSQAQ
jgi:peptidoglycan/LPS O-acetylase OafA/YrhL